MEDPDDAEGRGPAMRNGVLALATCLAATGLAWGQPPFVGPAAPPEVWQGFQPVPGFDYLVRANVEYLLWFVKDGPNPVPLATTGDPNSFPIAALGTPGTTVLFGGRDLDYGLFSGVRLGLAGWFGPDGLVGFEGSGFLLERQSDGFRTGSAPDGTPPLGYPFFDPRPTINAENAFLVAIPGFSEGGMALTSSSRFWGADGNSVFCLYRTARCEFCLVAGFRYLDLDEDLAIDGRGHIVFLPGTETFLRLTDHFDTRNQFYGGQLGGRLSCRGNRLSLDLLTRVGLGSVHQELNVYGATRFVGTGLLSVDTAAPGAIFTQPSNIRQVSQDQFAVSPAVTLQVGCDVTRFCKLFAGYSFIYLSDVIRPGEQVDHVVNLGQSSILNGGVTGGPLRPAPIFETTSFWAQGINLGLELRY